MDVETFYDGILAAIVVPEGESALVGAPIGLLADTEADVADAKAKAAAKSSGSGSAATEGQAVAPSPPPSTSTPAPAIAQPAASAALGAEGQINTVATPFAKKLAKQHKVDINNVVGTGPHGRITPTDAAAGITKNLPPPPAAAPAKASAASTSALAPAPPPLPGSTIVPFTKMQAAMSKNMVDSLSVPTFRVGYPVATDALDALYEKVKPKGVTMTALLAKAVAMALAQLPAVNSSCKDGKSFTCNSNINIAVAVAINGGLITPVLQDADKLDLYLLSKKMERIG